MRQSSSLKSPSISKEDRAEAREKLRAEKAKAAQEIRERNALKRLASNSVRKVVSAKFNVSFLLTGAASKGLDEKEKANGVKIQKALALLERSCQAHITCSPKTPELNQELIDSTVEKAQK